MNIVRLVSLHGMRLRNKLSNRSRLEIVASSTHDGILCFVTFKSLLAAIQNNYSVLFLRKDVLRWHAKPLKNTYKENHIWSDCRS